MDRASVLLELVGIYATLGRTEDSDRLRAEVDLLMEGVAEPEAHAAPLRARALRSAQRRRRQRRRRHRRGGRGRAGGGGTGGGRQHPRRSPP